MVFSTIERILLAEALVCLCSSVVAATPCNGGDGGSQTVSIASGAYIAANFTMSCSRNVYLSYEENTQKVAVCAASRKGNRQYGSTTDGGTVSEAGAFSGTTAPAASLTSASGC
ncbi:MAG: hypothetical protein H6R07_2378 [Proteobacteria bacterium]|nr:hypothetical protein [Pseudomonadota bacterium]